MILLLVCLFWELPASHAQQGQHLLLENGMQHYQQAEYLEASRYFQELTKEKQAPKEAYNFLTACYLQLNEPEKAVLSAQEGLGKFEKDFQLKWLLGEAYLMNDQLKLALGQFLDVQQQNMFGHEALPEQLKQEDLKGKIGAVYRQLGSESFQAKELQEAATYFRKALESLPGEVEIYQNLAYVYAQLKVWNKVVETADAGLEHFPDHVGLRQLKGQAYYENKDYASLLQEYEKLYRQNPAKLDVVLPYAEVLLLNKKPQQAVVVYEKFLEQVPGERKVYAALISLNEQFQNVKGKIKVLQRMKNQFPKDQTLYRSLAESFELLEEWEGARQVYDTLLFLTKDQAWVQKQIARTYIQQDSIPAALEIYLQLVDQELAGPNDLIKAAELAEQLKKWEEALHLYQMVEETNRPGYVMSRMGFVYEQLEDEELAKSLYQEAVYLQTDYPLAYFRLAALKLHENQELAFKLAQKAVHKSLERVVSLQEDLMGLFSGKQDQLLNPAENKQLLRDMKAFNQLSKTVFAFLSMHFPEAEVNPFLDQLVNQYPASGELFYLMGNHYKYHRKYEVAISWYRKATLKKPELKEAHLALGSIYEKTMKEKEAILSYERALSLDGQDRQAYRGLIRMYQQQGQLEQLWPKWLVHYRAANQNSILREHLIEVLHKDGQYELAKKIIEDK